MKKGLITSCILLITLSCCSFVPEYQRPALNMAENWRYAPSVQESNSIVLAKDWWKSFDIKELDVLIETALAQNYELEAGVHKIKRARIALRSAGASLLPTLDVSGSGSYSKNNPTTGASSNSRNYTGDLAISYTLDIFGANRADIVGSKANVRASQFTQEALKLTIIGEVVRTYFSLLTLQERLSIADNNLKNAKKVLTIITNRVNRGSESELQLAQQLSAVSSSEAVRLQLVQQYKNAENALAILVGIMPQEFEVSTPSLRSVKIPDISHDQPSSLLERRPDIRAAEEALIAANADIGAARAALYPSISLNSSISAMTRSPGDSASTVLSLASSITIPIFRGGALQDNLEQTSSIQKELIANYKQSIITAVSEVEDALIAVDMEREREDSLGRAMKNAKKAYLLSKKRYDAGAIDFQTLLDTQNTQLSAEDTFSQARLKRLNAAINLYLALGGGWSSSGL